MAGYSSSRARVHQAVLFGGLAIMAAPGWAQGPTPETGNTIFPGGGLVSYAADLFFRKPPAGITSIRGTILPTTGVSQPLQLSWGVRRDLELTAMISIETNHLSLNGPAPEIRAGGTGLGDSLLLMKCRFLRRDSERGTCQRPLTASDQILKPFSSRDEIQADQSRWSFGETQECYLCRRVEPLGDHLVRQPLHERIIW
jgi:hypothetical protein